MNSKWMEKTGRTPYVINHSKLLYDPPPRVVQIKTKIIKWDKIKLKSFPTAKETMNKVKRQYSEWEKITANETTDEGFISKRYQHSYKSIPGKKTTQTKIKKWQKDLNRHLSKDLRWILNT